MDFTFVLVSLLSILSSECIAQPAALSAHEFFDQSEASLQLVVKKVEVTAANVCRELCSTDFGVSLSGYHFSLGRRRPDLAHFCCSSASCAILKIP